MQRKSALWIYSMFFYGEDSVADNLSPYIDAAPREEQKYFLATQQVDEVRHAVFFHRFFKEVIGAGDSIASTLAYTEQFHNWGYRNVFERLDRMADELRRDRSLPKFAQAITLYHLVVEGDPGPARPALHRGLLRQVRRRCPASARAWSTSRATSSGTSASASRSSPSSSPSRTSARRRSARSCSRSCPTPTPSSPRRTSIASTRAATGSRWRTSGAFGLRSVRTKWNAIGYPLEEMQGVLPVDPDLPLDELAAQQIMLLEAGVLGAPGIRKPESSPRCRSSSSISIARSADTSARPAADRSMELHRRRALPRGRRQRLDPLRAWHGREARPDLGDELGRLDRRHPGHARPAQGDAEPAAALPRLAAEAAGVHKTFPRPRARAIELAAAHAVTAAPAPKRLGGCADACRGSGRRRARRS